MFGDHSSVHKRFFEVARRFPSQPAIVFLEGGSWREWSYERLASRARTVLRDLAARDVGGGHSVGLVAARHPDTIAAMIAILARGAQYLPLDASYPADRLGLLCRDANVGLVLSAVPIDDPRRISPMPIPIQDLADSETGLVPLSEDFVTGDAAAYVMFTSGSTGVPKGVVVPHRAILRLIDNQNFVTLDSGCAFLHLAPQSFDASTLEIWGPLLNGGRCVLFPEGWLPTAANLRSVITATKTNRLWLTSSLFNGVLDQDPKCFEGIEELLTGGEALSVPHVIRAIENLPRTQLVNGYGPTENTTFTTCYRVPRTFSSTSRSVPIGYPIKGTEIVVVDSALEPVPPGTEGELVATGLGLALHYLGRPELTRERFVVVKTASGVERGYRTGDRVIQTTEGLIEFVGRFDDQVKIDGHRIEPGEIERVIIASTGVSACRVLARMGAAGQKRLVAYVVAEAQSEAMLRALLTAKLPTFMMPHYFFFLATLPINANGKLDKDALPDPFAVPASSAPSPRCDDRVLAAWQQILGVRSLDENVNFFEAGGTSLEALRLYQLLCDAFGRELEPTFVFEYTTIRRQIEALLGDVDTEGRDRAQRRRVAGGRRGRGRR